MSVQLVSLTLYSPQGESKTIPFKLGALNVITGQSKTGKSVLVKLIDYCFGRADIPTSAGRVEESLAWVGALWQFEDGGRAFVGRPVPSGTARTNAQSALVFGDGDLQPLPFEALEPNGNTTTMRIEVGHRIGITESRLDVPEGSLRTPLRTNLGHAALLCIQSQDEISNSTRIFHRQGEPFINDTLRDTIPYFLRAVPPDQALKKAHLRQERRRLARTERDLRDAENAAKEIDENFRALLLEAIDVGLLEGADDPRDMVRADIFNELHRARQAPRRTPETGQAMRDQDVRRTRDSELRDAEAALDLLMNERALLLDEQQYGGDYAASVEVQLGRMTSLDLFDVEHTGDVDHAHAQPQPECPVCGQRSEAPTVGLLRSSLETLRTNLSSIRGSAPARSEALDQLNVRIAAAQSLVQQARSLLEATLGAEASVGRDEGRRADFTRGRIDATMARAPLADDGRVDNLRQQVELVRQSVRELEDQLSDERTQAILTSRLIAVGETLTNYAQRLHLEHSERSVRLDLGELTVIADVNDTPVPLARIGSAENWIGYHIASHLALHDAFIRHQGPVPRILVIDQPSQGHYPSEMAKRTGKADTDVDEIAVRGLYDLMDDFTKERDGAFQIIAVDHADIDADWFQEAIVDNWRGDDKGLIPQSWVRSTDADGS